MNNRLLTVAWLVTLALSLAGCSSSPPNNYYLLSAPVFPAPSGTVPTLGIGPIRVPEYLSRQNIVYNRADNTLQVASLDLWGEPLENGIQRVMALNLTGLLNTQNVSFFPWLANRAPQFGVEVNLLQLDANEREALLTAEWLVYRPARAESARPGSARPGSARRRISRLQVPLPAGSSQPEQVAVAYSTLLFQLSEVIAAAIEAERAISSDIATR